MKKDAAKIVEGEDLNLIIAGCPLKDGEKEGVKEGVEEKEKELINRQVAIRQQEQIVEDREQQVNRREAKMLAFLESNIGKKAMQEYNAVLRNNTVTPTRGRKHGGKIGHATEREMEVK